MGEEEQVAEEVERVDGFERAAVHVDHCLLYTSDAADDRSSVDLGGRRIIKKKTGKCLSSSVARASMRKTTERGRRMHVPPKRGKYI